jgi:hypothetical protein
MWGKVPTLFDLRKNNESNCTRSGRPRPLTNEGTTPGKYHRHDAAQIGRILISVRRKTAMEGPAHEAASRAGTLR